MKNFDLEFELSEFRVNLNDLFDSEGKRYTGVRMSDREAEKMLYLINELEKEFKKPIIVFKDGTYIVCDSQGEAVEQRNNPDYLTDIIL